MAHDCEYCGQACYCDCDDMGGLPQPTNCRHLTRFGACRQAAEEFGYDEDEDWCIAHGYLPCACSPEEWFDK